MPKNLAIILPGFGGSGRGPLKNGEFGSSSSFSFGGTGFDSSTFGLVKNKNSPNSVKTRDHRNRLSFFEQRTVYLVRIKEESVDPWSKRWLQQNIYQSSNPYFLVKKYGKVQKSTKVYFSLDSGPRGDSHLINKGPRLGPLVYF